MPDNSDKFYEQLLRSFVHLGYPKEALARLVAGLRGLHHVRQQRDWEAWEGVIDAFTQITQDVCAELGEPDFREVDTTKGSPFQTYFLPRWERYETLQPNNDPLTKQERADLRHLVRHPDILIWRSGKVLWKQRQMTHPRRVVAAYKAEHREPSDPDAKPTLAATQHRVIIELDQQMEAMRVEAAARQRKLDDHEWDRNAQVAELLDALVRRVRDASTVEQAKVIVRLMDALGFSGSFLDVMTRVINAEPRKTKK